jgi:hypothetical protein
MAAKAKTVSKKLPILNFRASPQTKARLRASAARIGVSQGELVRRFIAALPGSKGKIERHVKVRIAA